MLLTFISTFIKNISVFVVTYRILLKCCMKDTISCVFALIIAIIYSFDSFKSLLCLIVFIIFMLFQRLFVPKVKNYLRNNQNREDYLHFLEKLNLKIQNQQSFSFSIKQLRLESDAFMQQNAFIYDEFVLFSPQKRQLSVFQQHVLRQLSYIHDKPHCVSDYLQTLWMEEKQKSIFRHKSGQISFQARFQCLLMLGMFFVIAILQYHFVDKNLFFRYLFMALPFMLLAILWMLQIMRSFRWKV